VFRHRIGYVPRVSGAPFPSSDRDQRIAALEALLVERDAALADARVELAARDLLIETLRVQIARLKRMQFGKSSEKLIQEIAQLELALEELEAEAATADQRKDTAAKAERPSPVRSLPAHLPREDVVHEPASGVCACPSCGGVLRPLGADADEMLDVVPVSWRVVRHVRPKYSCRSCEKIVQAPAPVKAIARGKATFATLAHVVVSKFDHHLPLYRQAEMMAAQGVDIDRSTLAGWTGQAAALLDPIVSRIRDEGLRASKIHADDTPVPVLDPGRGKTATGRLWAYAVNDRASGAATPPLVWYAFTPDRSGVHPQRQLAGFTGFLQADAYAGYGKLYESGRVTEVACWAHCRRKIFDIHQTKPTALTTDLLERIGALYAIEAEVRGQPPDTRRSARQDRTRPLIEQLRLVLDDVLRRLSPKSEMAKAIAYGIKRWPALTRFLNDGLLEIDNNIAERALRGIAIGRKNWLFAGSKTGGERAAAIYTVIETCKANSIDPQAYIADVTAKIAADWPASRWDELLPWNWRQITEAPAAQAA
jgi:transposase